MTGGDETLACTKNTEKLAIQAHYTQIYHDTKILKRSIFNKG